MNITINGKERALSACASLEALIRESVKEPELVIAELNGAIIDRALWPDTALKDGDRLELVTFVGGG